MLVVTGHRCHITTESARERASERERVRERVCTVKAMLTPIRASYGRDADASARQRFAALVPRAAAGRKRPAAARGLSPWRRATPPWRRATPGIATLFFANRPGQ